MFKKQTQIYRPILRKAWEITRQNRFLWIFGIFAALAGNSGVYEILLKGFDRVVARGGSLPAQSTWLWITGMFSFPRLEDIYIQSPFLASLLWIIFFGVVAVLGVVIWLSMSSRAALITSVKKIAGRKKTNLHEGWTEGKKYFWPVLGLNLLSKALVFVLLLLITIPAMLYLTGQGGNMGVNLFFYVLAFIIFTVLALIVSFMAVYASCFVVAAEKTFVEAIVDSWKMFIKNWLVSIEMALILFVLAIGVGLGLIVFTVLYMIPVALILFALSYLELSIGFWLIMCLATLGWFVALFFAGAIFSAFQFSSWTLLFLELCKRRVWSKILRFAGVAR